MSYLDWQSGVTVSSPNSGYICTSTVDDLSYTPSAEERTRDAAQVAATGRRSWKTLRGKGEAVWPPHLEAALIEALEKYQPDAPRSVKIVGRFPMRNRFISDYIFETTGKRRTPKQVGSRIQQLRDTCKGEKILHLIERRNSIDVYSSSSHTETSRAKSLTPTSNSSDTSDYRRPAIYVNIVLKQATWESPRPVIQLIDNGNSAPHYVSLSPLQDEFDYSNITPTRTTHPSSSVSILRGMDPTVSLVSMYALVLHSSFSVYLEGGSLPIYTEVVRMKCQSSSIESSGWVYNTSIVPGFWEDLVNSPDPTQYSIIQNITPILQERHSSSSSELQDNDSIISVIYNFSYPEYTHDQGQQSMQMGSYHYDQPPLHHDVTNSFTESHRASSLSDVAAYWPHHQGPMTFQEHTVPKPIYDSYPFRSLPEYPGSQHIHM